jgi:hypothetical protein
MLAEVLLAVGALGVIGTGLVGIGVLAVQLTRKTPSDKKTTSDRSMMIGSPFCRDVCYTSDGRKSFQRIERGTSG